jgi:hypothetical protein
VDDLEAAQLVSLQVYAKSPAVRASVCVASRVVLAVGKFRGAQLEAARTIARCAVKSGLLPVVLELDQTAQSEGLGNADLLVQSARSVVVDISSVRQGKKLLEHIARLRSDVPVLLVWQASQAEPGIEAPDLANIVGIESYRDSAHLESILLEHLSR